MQNPGEKLDIQKHNKENLFRFIVISNDEIYKRYFVSARDYIFPESNLKLKEIIKELGVEISAEEIIISNAYACFFRKNIEKIILQGEGLDWCEIEIIFDKHEIIIGANIKFFVYPWANNIRYIESRYEEKV